MNKIMKKRITNLLIVLILCFSIIPTSFASEASNVNYKNGTMSITMSIIVADENGKDKQYNITEGSMIEVPIYMAKEAEEGVIEPQSLTQLATLTISIDNGRAYFAFTPSSFSIALLTIGFTGQFTTYLSGIRYGYNFYTIPISSGFVSAPSSGTGSLSGTYSVLGYESVDILKAFSW